MASEWAGDILRGDEAVRIQGLNDVAFADIEGIHVLEIPISDRGAGKLTASFSARSVSHLRARFGGTHLLRCVSRRFHFVLLAARR